MAVLAAVNLEDGLVLLEDGRELPITGFYANMNPSRGPLSVNDALLASDRVTNWLYAEVFAVEIPGAGTGLIVEINALGLAKPSDIN